MRSIPFPLQFILFSRLVLQAVDNGSMPKSPTDKSDGTHTKAINLWTFQFRWDSAGKLWQFSSCHGLGYAPLAMASQITSLTIVYSTIYSGAYQRKHQSSAPLAFVRGPHRWPVNSPHKWPVTREMLTFNDVIAKVMTVFVISWPGLCVSCTHSAGKHDMFLMFCLLRFYYFFLWIHMIDLSIFFQVCTRVSAM